MKTYPWYLQLSGEVAQALNGHYMPKLQALMEEYELDGTAIGAAQLAYSEDPNPTTAAVFLERTPYMKEETVHANLASAAEQGVLTAVAGQANAYSLTEKGRTFAQAVPQSVVDVASGLDPLPAAKLERVAALLRRLVDASMAAAEPAKPCLKRSRSFDPGADAPVLERIRRYLNDLNAFRDDVHMAAWRPYDVTGHEWEAFSHVHGEFAFGDPVDKAAGLVEKLSSFRGFDEAEYQQALDKLSARGWLRVADGSYAATDEGKSLRAAAEVDTDRYFYTPWDLSDAELAELQELLEALRDGLQPDDAE